MGFCIGDGKFLFIGEVWIMLVGDGALDVP